MTLWSAPYAGGAARRFVELLRGLSARGTDVVLLSVHDCKEPMGLRVEPISLPHGPFRAIRTKFSRGSFRNTEALLDRYRPDLVFAFGLTNGSILCPLAQKRQVPSVLFIRGMELTPREYRRVPFSRVPALGTLSHALYVRVFQKYAQSIFRQAGTVVFQHREQHQAYLDHGLLSRDCPCAVEFLPNNSNPSWLPPCELSRMPREPRTVIAANLYWGKGFKIALDAFQIVRARLPDAQLTILGDGPEGASIRRYAARIPGVTFEGHVRNVHSYFRHARLLVHPTLFELGSPNIVLEAAGWGFPMIVSDKTVHTVGTRHWVYPAHDHESLAKLWGAALTDEVVHERLCRESRELGEQYRFDWVTRAQGILNSSWTRAHARSADHGAQ